MYIRGMNENKLNDYYYLYLEFTDLLNDLKAVGVDTNRQLDYNSFINAVGSVEAIYTVKENKEESIKEFLENNNMEAKLKLNYTD